VVCVTCAPGRLRADLQQPRYLHRVRALLEHARSLPPHHLPAGPAISGQPATIRVPHDTGLAQPTAQPAAGYCRLPG
jgi:hypothetical protein